MGLFLDAHAYRCVRLLSYASLRSEKAIMYINKGRTGQWESKLYDRVCKTVMTSVSRWALKPCQSRNLGENPLGSWPCFGDY